MPDYGHALAFGTFITPTNKPAEEPVALAQLSEQLGFDLVTFQDHPYQAAFLDTWTLLAFVAARTERVQVSANVLNLPLRPPAVAARAAASLDLLSGGRFALGLGAGGFWDAIEAMGGPRRTPGQGVDALAEAIQIIRGIWNVDNRAPLRLAGDHYTVNGAKRGPAPAHDIPIWLGAAKPRMLRLIGRAADGWLPSLSWLQPGDLGRGNAIIDESALKAGREPAVIRRLLNIGGNFSPVGHGALNGPASRWVAELTTLALEDGIATFILASDDPATLQQFAEEVVPGLREAVATARKSSSTRLVPQRSAIVLAKRREGIDYDAIPESLRETAVEPGDPGYPGQRSTYLRAGAPGLILHPQTVEQVVEALDFAKRQPVPLGIRSAGHGLSGRSTNDGGIIISVAALNSIEVLDEATRRFRVGPGAHWSQVAAALEPHGWSLTSGDYGGVGVGGLATAGGIGWLAREHGLTIDHLRAVDIVVADGRVVRASDTENADLFWAVRGAGANFGIVVSFEFEADEQPTSVGYAQFVHDATDVEGVLEKWGALVESAPRDVTSALIMQGGTPPIASVMAVVDSDDPDTIIARLQPFADIAPLLRQSVQLMPYAEIMANDREARPQNGHGEPHARSGFVEHITPEFARAGAAAIASGGLYWFQMRAVGGAVSDVPRDATAYAHRSANFSLVTMGADNDRLNSTWEGLRDHLSGLYLSFETGLHDGRIADAFPPSTLARLIELKRDWDPANVFRDNFNIVPPGD